MKRKSGKLPLVIALWLLATLPLGADSFFSNYDFTFYKTVSQSLNIMDSSTVGFDYTGFGFIGERNTNGLFVRIGIQLPYTTLENIFIPDAGTTGQGSDSESSSGNLLDGSDASGDLGLVAGTGGDLMENEYRLTLILGPAMRHVFSPYFDFYAGLGPKLEEHIMSETSRLDDSAISSYNTVLAFDIDLGFKFNLAHHTSFRIGLYSTFEILSYTYTSMRDDEGVESFATSNIHFNAIASGDARSPLSAVGYVSMGTTFNSSLRTTVWRYETTEREVGKGTSTAIGSL